MTTDNRLELNALAQSLADAESESVNAPRFYITVDKATGRNVWNRVTNRVYPAVWRHAEANPYKGTQPAHACDGDSECQYVEHGPYSEPRRAATGILPARQRRLAAMMRERPLGLDRTPTATPLGWSEAMRGGDVKISAPGIDRDGYYSASRAAYRLHGPEGGDRDRQAIAEQFPALHAQMFDQSSKAERLARGRETLAAKRAAAKALRASLASDGPVTVPSRTYVRQGDARLVRVMAD